MNDLFLMSIIYIYCKPISTICDRNCKYNTEPCPIYNYEGKYRKIFLEFKQIL